MRLRLAAVVCAGLLLSLGAAGLAPEKRVHRVVDYDKGWDLSHEELWEQSVESRWQEEGPGAFLDELRRREAAQWAAHKRHATYVFDELHLRWVRKSDVPELLELLDSTERCASVKSSISSFADSGGSTLGHEAGLLIDAYRTGRYPDFLNSARERISNDELRSWWLETGFKEKDRWDR